MDDKLLERIVLALEEANRLEREWMATNARWHEEAEALNEVRHQQNAEREKRIVAIQEANAKREEQRMRDDEQARQNLLRLQRGYEGQEP